MTGLVLEGGAMRGIFTAGVLDVFMENGIKFDNVIGVSAGACFGCNYVSGQAGRTIRYNMKYARDWRYCSFRSLFATGDIFGAEFCYHTLPTELDRFDEEAFIASGSPFYLVVTDVETGEAGYHRMLDGSYEEMCSSILNVVNKWGNDLTIYPGHGDPATMKTVRKINLEFLEIVNGN